MEIITITGRGIAIRLKIDDSSIIDIDLTPGNEPDTHFPYSSHLTPFIQPFEEYLSGKPVAFDLPLKLDRLTEFQADVFEQLKRVSYGQVISYEELAIQVRGPDHRRAVARALSANPFPIVIPCHRVVPKHFSPDNIGGFSCGTDIKRILLKLEGVLA